MVDHGHHKPLGVAPSYVVGGKPFVCDECDHDRQLHAHYIAGGGFVWERPRLNVYKPSNTRPRALLNRYPHNVIGAAVVLFGRCWGVTWKGSPRRGKRDHAPRFSRLRARIFGRSNSVLNGGTGPS